MFHYLYLILFRHLRPIKRHLYVGFSYQSDALIFGVFVISVRSSSFLAIYQERVTTCYYNDS